MFMTVGLTFRTLEEEHLRFLTERGANQIHLGERTYDNKARNRPILLQSDGDTITMGEAKVQGFKGKG